MRAAAATALWGFLTYMAMTAAFAVHAELYARAALQIVNTAWAGLLIAHTLDSLSDGLAVVCCQRRHGGGHLWRDEEGRLCWRCARCQRWGEPIPPERAEAAIARAIAAARA